MMYVPAAGTENSQRKDNFGGVIEAVFLDFREIGDYVVCFSVVTAMRHACF